MSKILIVEDEENIVNIIKYNLEKNGYSVECAYDGEEGLKKALEEKPELILLDVMMPKMDGFEVAKQVREHSQVPIIMLTARAEEVDKLYGFDSGADDYVTKPFSVQELMARVKANLRKRSAEELQKSDKINTIGDIEINTGMFEVKRDGELIELTRKEFDLLSFLASNPSQVFTREELLEKVWGYKYFGDVRAVDVTIRRLRTKLELNPENPKYIMTKRGAGYYFGIQDGQ